MAKSDATRAPGPRHEGRRIHPSRPRLKEVQDKDIVVFRSGVLIRSLMRYNLVDVYSQLIHPLVLGAGRRLFTDGGAFAALLRLVGRKTTITGVVIANYEPAGSGWGSPDIPFEPTPPGGAVRFRRQVTAGASRHGGGNAKILGFSASPFNQCVTLKPTKGVTK